MIGRLMMKDFVLMEVPWHRGWKDTRLSSGTTNRLEERGLLRSSIRMNSEASCGCFCEKRRHFAHSLLIPCRKGVFRQRRNVPEADFGAGKNPESRRRRKGARPNGQGALSRSCRVPWLRQFSTVFCAGMLPRIQSRKPPLLREQTRTLPVPRNLSTTPSPVVWLLTSLPRKPLLPVLMLRS